MNRTFTWLTIAALLLPSFWTAPGAVSPRQSGLSVASPVLKWSGKGCYSSWCETGWYSSPSVADLDGDGQVEVIASAYSIVALDGDTGALKWRVYSGHDRSTTGSSNVGRTWPGIVTANIDGLEGIEIVTAHSGGWVSVYDQDGYFKPGWPRQITPGSEIRSLGAADLDGDGGLEIMAAATRSQDQWYVLQPDGAVRPGSWPQHGPDSNTNGYTAGCYNQNLAAGDIDGDGRGEIVGPNDTHYIAAFEDDGSQVRANPLYGLNPDGSQKVWSRVGVHVDHAVDLRGYANCGSEHRPNFANSAPIIVDVNHDGTQEIVVIGNIYDCGASPYRDLYEIPYIFNGDRTRWKAGSFDWTVLPAPEPGAAPLSEDYNRIENNASNPVAADLDGDGLMEILYPSYDGRLHAYWLDRTQHGNWPYAVTRPGEGWIRFASEPVVADLDQDGLAEVIFTSWVEKGSNLTGKLHILDSAGSPLWEVDLPAAVGGANWNGALAAPTLANIDSDPDLEVVINTAHSGVAAYDLPGTSGARLLWATGRGNFQRSGSLLTGDLSDSVKTVSNPAPLPGSTVQFTITVKNTGPGASTASLQDPLPAGLTFAGGLSASSGEVTIERNTVLWNGAVPPNQSVIIEYLATVTAGASGREVIYNEVELSGSGVPLRFGVLVVVSGLRLNLPFIGAR